MLAATDQPLNRFINEWLTRPHARPSQAREEWATKGVALIPMGRSFSAIRLDGRLIHAAVDTDNLSDIAEELAFRLDGAVIHDGFGNIFYALIEWHAAIVWDNVEGATALGKSWHVGVPHTGRVDPPGSYWLVPPRYEGDLCRPDALLRLVEQGRAAAARSDRSLKVAS